jgi:hypothetical protein
MGELTEHATITISFVIGKHTVITIPPTAHHIGVVGSEEIED